MKSLASRSLTAAVASIALVSSSAVAMPASQLRDLVGARGSSGESQLESRGFTYITGNLGEYDTKHSYYWHSRDKNCVHVETYDGRYTTIADASRQDCHQSGGGGDAAAAIGVVAGAALLAALAGGHKKHHHDDGQHYNDYNHEAQYEQGYNDGLHNVPYHNYSRSEPYADGFRAGTQQRRNNTRYHDGYGGYSQKVAYNDIQGESELNLRTLEQRGFRQVDRFNSGNTLYSIWSRPQSRQCLQATIADGRIYDIRDIGRHPNCR